MLFTIFLLLLALVKKILPIFHFTMLAGLLQNVSHIGLHFFRSYLSYGIGTFTKMLNRVNVSASTFVACLQSSFKIFNNNTVFFS